MKKEEKQENTKMEQTNSVSAKSQTVQKQTIEPPVPAVKSAKTEKKSIHKNKEKKGNTKKGKKKKSHTMRSTFIVIGLDVICAIALMFLFVTLPKEALQVKNLRNVIEGAKTRSEVEIADLQVKQNTEKAQTLFEIFPDEFGLVDFVQEIEILQKEGNVREFSFANQTVVNDKEGGLGIPVVIVFEGTWKEIDRDLNKLHNLDYLFRPITVEVERIDDAKYILNYGGFLYVSSEFQNR